MCPFHSSRVERKSLLEQGTAVMITCIPACSRSQTRQTTKYWELLNVLKKKKLLGFGSEGIGSFCPFEVSHLHHNDSASLCGEG